MAGTAVALAALALSAAPAGADSWTIDGKAATQEAAQQAAGGCPPFASDSGEWACFSSLDKQEAAELAALKAGGLPAGWNALPEASVVQSFIDKAQRATASRKKGPKAHASADNCGVSDTHVYTGTSQTGSQTWYGYINSWPNFGTPFRAGTPGISSYWASNFWTPTWHAGASGTGDYYNLAYTCRVVNDLANGSWDKRFYSYLNS